ncbi:MAG: hypothetical protein RR690_06740 [Longicatena sp.]
MNKTKKVSKISAISIVFYVVAVVFLCIAAFNIWQAYDYVQTQQAQYTLTLSYIFYVYSTYSAQYFAYAFILYGVGVGLSKINVLHYAFSEIVGNAMEEVEVSSTDDEVIGTEETPLEEAK